TRGRTLRRFDQRAVLAVVVALAVGVGVVAAARPAGRHWSEATTEHVARSGVDHTQSGLDWIRKDVAEAQPSAAAGGTGRWQQWWSAPASAQRQRVFLVPDTNVALAILGRAQGGETGVAALDAATGEERWHYRLPEDGIDGVAVSGVHQRVVVLVGDVAVQLDLATGTVVRRTVLPADPVDAAHGEAPATWFAIVGGPSYGVDYGGVASSRKDVFGFSDVLVLQQRMLLDGQVAAGKVLTLDLSGTTRTIERPPATGCRYSAFYESAGSTAVLVRDGANGSCGAVEGGIGGGTH